MSKIKIIEKTEIPGATVLTPMQMNMMHFEQDNSMLGAKPAAGATSPAPSGRK